jgi:hypothetical protein
MSHTSERISLLLLQEALLHFRLAKKAVAFSRISTSSSFPTFNNNNATLREKVPSDHHLPILLVLYKYQS